MHAIARLSERRPAPRRRGAERRAYERIAQRTTKAHRGESQAHPYPDPDEAMVVHDALRSLPPRQRQAVVLRFYSDLSHAEIAKIMGCRPGTVKAHLHKALNALRRQGLTDEDTEEVD